MPSPPRRPALSLLSCTLALLAPRRCVAPYTCNPSPGINRCDYRAAPRDQSAAAFAPWFAELQEWRENTRTELAAEGLDFAAYEQPGLDWARTAFIQPQLMVHDRYLYDRETGAYTVDRLLDDYEKRYGGIDAVLLWQGYPNLGYDDRNNFDLIRSMPGGLEGVSKMVADFHARGVKVMWPNFVWDHGTRNEGKAQYDALVNIIASTDSDGLNGDTMDGVNASFYNEGLRYGKALALQPQSMGRRNVPTGWTNVSHDVFSWAEGLNYAFAPSVSAYKLLEPRHLSSITERLERNRTNGIQYAFFNGAGYETWENVWGLFNIVTPRDSEAVRRTASILRQFGDLVTLGTWVPHVPVTSQAGVFASQFFNDSEALYTLVNRQENDYRGPQMTVECTATTRFFDVYRGRELPARCDGTTATLSFDIEGGGFGAVFVGEHAPDAAFMSTMGYMTERELRSYRATWENLPQSRTPQPHTPPGVGREPDTVLLPGGTYAFSVRGNIPQGDNIANAVDVQFPWEEHPRRQHNQLLTMPPLHVHKYPVTNEQFARFLAESGYAPRNTDNFLKEWVAGAVPAGYERKPVVWVSRADASAYCAHHDMRLPASWEWQWMAQGPDNRRWPWGTTAGSAGLQYPRPSTARAQTAHADVDAHPEGATPQGVHDLMWNVFQWTDEYCDEHTCYAVMRGGTTYSPQGSRYYFPRPADLREHNAFLSMSESMDRSHGFGFRCVQESIRRTPLMCEWQVCAEPPSQPAADTIVDLTTEGTRNYNHYGLRSADDVNQKNDIVAGCDFTTTFLDSAVPTQFVPANGIRFAWRDGMPTPVTTETRHGIAVAAEGLSGGRGFRITLPATGDCSSREPSAASAVVVRIYGAVLNSRGRLTATVGRDVARYSHVHPATAPVGDTEEVVWTIRYTSSSSDPTVVDWESVGAEAGANVILYAVTLADSPPMEGLTQAAISVNVSAV